MQKLAVNETGLKFSNVDIYEKFNVLDLVFRNIEDLSTVKTFTDELVEVTLENNQLFSILNGNKHTLLANLCLDDSERILNVYASTKCSQLFVMAQTLQTLVDKTENVAESTLYLLSEHEYLTRTVKTGDAIYLFLGYKVDGKFVSAIRLDNKDFYHNLVRTHKYQL